MILLSTGKRKTDISGKYMFKNHGANAKQTKIWTDIETYGMQQCDRRICSSHLETILIYI